VTHCDRLFSTHTTSNMYVQCTQMIYLVCSLCLWGYTISKGRVWCEPGCVPPWSTTPPSTLPDTTIPARFTQSSTLLISTTLPNSAASATRSTSRPDFLDNVPIASSIIPYIQICNECCYTTTAATTTTAETAIIELCDLPDVSCNACVVVMHISTLLSFALISSYMYHIFAWYWMWVKFHCMTNKLWKCYLCGTTWQIDTTLIMIGPKCPFRGLYFVR